MNKTDKNNTKTLLIDAGNSALKWATLQNQHLSKQQSYFYSEKTAIQELNTLLESQANSYQKIMMVSVLGDDFNQEAQQVAKKLLFDFKQIKSIKKLAGVTNAYDEPHKLGADRFVAMIAGYHLSNYLSKKQQQNSNACIIIDSGTATTIDAVDAQGNHLGGLILPGVDLCSNSLLQNTQQLPLWGKTQYPYQPHQKNFKPKLFSSNTVDAITSASIFGLSGAIQQICLNMEKAIKHKDKNIRINKLLCGGSAESLLPYLDADFNLRKDLIMQGLKVIAEMSYD